MRFLLRLFGEESAFGRFLNRLYVVVVTNLLFVLFSIPVITIGTSLSAMNYTLMKFQRGVPWNTWCPPTPRYRRAYIRKGGYPIPQGPRCGSVETCRKAVR